MEKFGWVECRLLELEKKTGLKLGGSMDISSRSWDRFVLAQDDAYTWSVSARLAAIIDGPGGVLPEMEDDYWLTDKEKQMLTNCPRCDASYGMGSSEVDADDICRVTCGQCGEMIEYQIEWI